MACLDYSFGDAAADAGAGAGVEAGVEAGAAGFGGASSPDSESALGASRSSSLVLEGVAMAPLFVWEAAGGESGSPGLGVSGGELAPRFWAVTGVRAWDDAGARWLGALTPWVYWLSGT